MSYELNTLVITLHRLFVVSGYKMNSRECEAEGATKLDNCFNFPMKWHFRLEPCNAREWVDEREQVLKLLNDDVNLMMTQNS